MIQVVYMVNPINLASLKFSGHFLVLKAYLKRENPVRTRDKYCSTTAQRSIYAAEAHAYLKWSVYTTKVITYSS